MMKITESNYEEYLLLYIDDELTSIERNAVETFVQQHPQYAAELEVLQQAKFCHEDTMDFASKNALFKNEENEIGIDNYGDYFLLYTDDELSEKDKINTERFVLQHPQLQTEFTWLQKTKLPVEAIEFVGKEKLYKQEKERRIIPLYFTRMAIAASLIILIALGWQLSPHKNIELGTTAKTVQPKQPIVIPLPEVNLPIETKKVQPLADASLPTNAQQKNSKLPTIKPGEQKVIAQPGNRKETTPDVTLAKESNTQDAPAVPEPTEVAMQKQPAVEVNQQAEVLKPLIEVDADETSTQTASTLSSDDNMAQPAVYKELNTEDNHSLYVGAFQLNKAKVNGFLKSASRLLGSKTKGASE